MYFRSGSQYYANSCAVDPTGLVWIETICREVLPQSCLFLQHCKTCVLCQYLTALYPNRAWWPCSVFSASRRRLRIFWPAASPGHIRETKSGVIRLTARQGGWPSKLPTEKGVRGGVRVCADVHAPVLTRTHPYVPGVRVD